MRIIISPAKKMQEDRENTLPLSQPAFLREVVCSPSSRQFLII